MLRAITALAVVIAATMAFAPLAGAHHLKGRWWEDLSMQERLEGQLHLREKAKKGLRELDTSVYAIKDVVRSGQSEKKHKHMLRVLRREIPETREALAAIAAAEEAAREAAEQSSYSTPTYYGGELPTASIIECESKGSYTAENPSGAYGRYQIMPEHWNGGTCSDLNKYEPADQDECAARLWDGGAGASNWEQCL